MRFFSLGFMGASLATLFLAATPGVTADEAATIAPLFSDLPQKNVEPHVLSSSTALPDWVTFERLVNGFGQYGGIKANETEPFYSWDYLFDVFAYVQQWKVEDGKITYGHKMINSDQYKGSTNGERPLLRSFGGLTPDFSPTEVVRVLAGVDFSDNYNVNIVRVADKAFAISDTAGQMEIDPETLDTIGAFHYADEIDSVFGIISCAHPTQLPGDKYMYNYQLQLFGNEPHLRTPHKMKLFRVDTTATPLTREVVMEIPLSDVSYLHQFANTPNYIVLFHYPLFWQVMGIATHTEILPNMKWDASKGTRVQVISKRTWRTVKEYTTDATFAYHHVNAYEDGNGNVVVDILTEKCDGSEGAASCEDMNRFQMNTLQTNAHFIPRSPLRRFTVPVEGNDAVVTWVDINNRGMGLHAIHPLLKGKKHRFVYSLDNHGEGVWWNSIVKVDMDKDDSASLQWYKEDHYPSEISFLPRPGATEEDDGVLITVVLGNDADVKTSYLLVLDAKDLTEIATVPAPCYLPFPSHGHTCAPIETSPGKLEKMCFWA